MKDKFEEFSCQFKNEAECEEEFDSEGLKLEEVDEQHFSTD